jgi:superfamily II DNA or RNA helicase
MATFDDFYKSLPEDSAKRGDFFEKVFIPWFLKIDPEWSTKIQKIWLWNEYPDRWGKDCGIDLVYEDRNGKHWAVQCKCVSPEREITKAEIDSFLSESNNSRIHGRLLIASTDGIGKNALQVLERQEKQVVCFLREHFQQSEVEFPSSPEDLSSGRRKDRREPRPHQEEAIRNVVAGLQKEDRGQLLMACGTGKTLTSLWIKETLNAKRTLILLPSLSLLSQTLREWTATSRVEFNWICICSDKSVAKQDKSFDDWIENVSALGVPVTSDPEDIRQFLQSNGEGVVFSTYQSSQLIAEAQKEPGIPGFDIAFADEAHRCAGKVSEAFGCVLNNQKIKAKKRLFMTATPRVLSSQIKTKAESEDIEVASMDDEETFGKVLHRLNFSEAIEKDLLSDYRVIVIGVDDPEVKAQIINGSLISTDNGIETDFETLASHVSLAKAIREYDLQRVITFHGRIKGARKFSENHPEVVRWLPPSSRSEKTIKTVYVSGEMSSFERNNKINQLRNLKDGEVGILSNARCLSEGVDVPTLDGIAFIDPRSSQVDIIQAVGRAIRKSESKSCGYIIIPVYLGDTENFEEDLMASKFKDVWEIILALKSQDDTLAEVLDRLRIEIGNDEEKASNTEGIDKIIFDLPQRIQSSIGDSIRTFLIRNTTDNWNEFYGGLLNFSRQHGHCIVPSESDLYRWNIYQRVLFKRSTLSHKKVSLLETLDGWTWDPLDSKWEAKYSELKSFSDINGHARPIPSTDRDLFTWVNQQRKSIRKGLLDSARQDRLKSLPQWIDNPRENDWEERLIEITDFCHLNGHSYPDASSPGLRAWVTTRRSAYKINKLESEQVEALEQLPGWSWEHRNVWQDNYEELKDYANDQGTSNISRTIPRIGAWVKTQRTNFNAQKLDTCQIALLESLPGWSWNPIEDEWNKNFIELVFFAKKNGHTRPLRSKSSLGSWSSTQRSAYAKGTLSSDRISRLESIDEWSWDVREQDWECKYEQLKSYALIHRSLPPKVDPQYGAWIIWQRNKYRQGKLEKGKITLLEKIASWSW